MNFSVEKYCLDLWMYLVEKYDRENSEAVFVENTSFLT